MRVAIVGRGKVGRALAAAARKRGLDVRATGGRTPAARALRDAELVVLAVPDQAIAEVGAAIAPSLSEGAAVVHCAGARGADELAAVAAAGHPVGAMHPLASFARADDPPELAGTSFVIGGAPDAARRARALAHALGARAVLADVHGPAYHAVAALVANGAAALAAAGAPVLVSLGLGRREAQRALGALLRTVAENVERVGVPESLTGPVARGDAETVRWHRAALEAHATARLAYDGVAPAVLACALAAGLPRDRAEAVARVLRARPRKRLA